MRAGNELNINDEPDRRINTPFDLRMTCFRVLMSAADYLDQDASRDHNPSLMGWPSIGLAVSRG